MFQALSIIFSVIVLELILSVDNILVNASLAKDLPASLQKKAVYWGIGIAALFRVLCLFVATIIIQNPYIKVLGAFYLLYLSFSHFFLSKEEEKERQAHPHFVRVILEIAVANLVFSIDNIVGVIGISSHFAYIVSGVLIGIVVMVVLTPQALRLMNAFPTLIKTAYVIIAYIGITILLDVFLHVSVSEYVTFGFIMAAVIGTILSDRRYALRN